jgi:hypothetical protein
VRYAASGRPWPYILADGRRLPTSGRFVTDDTGSIREAVMCGAGISYLLHVTVAQDFAKGRLVELLPDLELPTMPVFRGACLRSSIPRAGEALIGGCSETPAPLNQLLLPRLVMPHHHDVRAEDIVTRHLHGNLAAAAECGPTDFSALLRPRPYRFSDPARFSVGHVWPRIAMFRDCSGK